MDTINGVVASLDERNDQHLITLQLNRYESCAGLARDVIKNALAHANGDVIARYIDNQMGTHEDRPLKSDQNITTFLNTLGLYPQMTHDALSARPS